MNLILFDQQQWKNLLPLSFTKPVSELRVGILTITEKWEKRVNEKVGYMAEPYLREKYPMPKEGDSLFICGALLPDDMLLSSIINLRTGESLKKGGTLLASRIENCAAFDLETALESAHEYSEDVSLINYPWNIFSLNGQEIETDYTLLTSKRQSAKLSKTVNTINAENIFVENGFKGEFITLNATYGPIYLGKDTEIMEGSVIRGPFALGEDSALKLATKVYGPSTIGPYCKAGGELNNVVMQGYSNKGHDGFLGNAVIGEWCNLGADTNNSNLKNNYTEVKVWNYPANRFIKTGLQFCGLIMGDHSKCGINTMFNTGSVVGVSANIFGSGFPRNFIPSFSWGGASGMTIYKKEKAFETMELVMARRDKKLSDIDRRIMIHIFDSTASYRK